MLATVLIAVVAFIHLYILVLEMFLWDTRTGHKAFNLSPEFARETRVLAANQGLYNGFLAAGLLWSLWLGEEGVHVAIFFLACQPEDSVCSGFTCACRPACAAYLKQRVGQPCVVRYTCGFILRGLDSYE